MKTITLEALSVNVTGCGANCVNLEIDMSDNEHAQLFDTFSDDEIFEQLDLIDLLAKFDDDALIKELENRGYTIEED